MNNLSRLRSLCAILLLACAPIVALGQTYPTKAIRIVTGDVGGGSDFTARIIAQGLTTALEQSVMVDNRGGGAVISAELVAKAPPDGYTLLVAGSPLWLVPLMEHATWDPVRDFAAVTLIQSSPNVLIVSNQTPAKTVQELIALAKAKPAQLNYASGGVGSSPHLGAELFKSMAGINMVHVPYKTIATAVSDLIANRVQVMVASAATAAPHVKAGQVRALAVTSARPSALVPGLPTIGASGVPGYEWVTTLCLFAPAKTPAAIIQKLNAEVVRTLKQSDIRDEFFNAGTETVGSSPEELTSMIKAEIARISKVIKDGGIHE